MNVKISSGTVGKLKAILTVFKKDPVFTASFILAATSCFIAKPRAGYIDFKVLACLFNIMVAVKAFDELHLLEKMSISILNKCSASRSVSLVLIILSFFCSMLLTNDVALLTLVPLALIIGKKSDIDMMPVIILQTLAANIGSSLTPMGNPQNLYLFSYFRLNAGQFFTTVGIFVALGFVWLLLLNRRNPNSRLDFKLDQDEIKDTRLAAVWGTAFIVIVLSVFGIVHYAAAFILTLVLSLCLNRKLLMKVDYPLLLTFICFFIFIGNISHMPLVGSLMKNFLNTGAKTYFGSILLSQVISNVPCAILLSGFTVYWKELLLGVNIGGMGTIIASLASVISYKLYIADKPDNAGKYMARFSIYNLVSLTLFTLLNYLLLLL